MQSLVSAITQCKVSDEHERKWIQTRSVLLWTCPAFTHILFSMLNPTKGELVAYFTKDIPTAATDGTNLVLNPDWYFTMPLGERIFVGSHEILHCILNHCVMSEPWHRTGKVKYQDGTVLDYDADQMNIAMDYVINAILVEDKIGTMPASGYYDPLIATSASSFLDVYRKLFRTPSKMPAGGHGAGQGTGTASKAPHGFDKLLRPGTVQGKDPQQAIQERSETEWNTAVAAAVASAKAQGKLPASLERLLSEVLEPVVDWQDHIRAFFARKVGGGNYDWKRADRRLIQRDIFHPRRSGMGVGEIVVGVDTSGSIGDKQLAVFFAEMRGILEDVRPTKIHVVWCDAKVHKVDECDQSSDVGGLKPKGGGGTDFRPVFDWIYDNDVYPEALVYLTDGYGTFPDRAPTYPVLWGDIVGSPGRYPFGTVVDVPIKQR